MAWPWDAVAYTLGPAMLESVLSFFSQQGGQCQWCAIQPLSDTERDINRDSVSAQHDSRRFPHQLPWQRAKPLCLLHSCLTGIDAPRTHVSP